MNDSQSSPSFLALLKQCLPPSDWPWMVSALRHDKRIWNSLQEPVFCKAALNLYGEYPGALSPAGLALLANSQEEDPISDVLHRLEELQIDLERKSIEEPDKTEEIEADQPGRSTSSEEWPLASLKQAGQMALAGRTQRQDEGSWSAWVAWAAGETGQNDLLKTVVACLAGMIPDPCELFQALAQPGAGSDLYHLAIYGLLANPYSPHEQRELIAEILKPLPAADQVRFLQGLSTQRAGQATETAAETADRLKAEAEKAQEDPNMNRSAARISGLARWVLAAEAYRLAENPKDSRICIERALEDHRCVESELNKWAARTAVWSGDGPTARRYWQHSIELCPNDDESQAGTLLASLETGDFQETPQDSAGDPSFQGAELGGAYARLVEIRFAANQGEPDLLRNKSGELLGLLRHDRQAAYDLFWPSQKAVEFVRLVLGHDLADVAFEWTRFLLDLHLNQPDLLALAAEAQAAAGDTHGAVEAAELATSLAPDQVDFRRLLAGLYEVNGHWSAALSVRSEVIRMVSGDEQAGFMVSANDWLALSQCALHAGQVEQALEAAQRVEDGPATEVDRSRAQLMFGEVEVQKGNFQEARQYFLAAQQICPQLGRAWLALARLEHQSGESLQALEILRAAAQANPNDPEVYLALGEAYLEDWEGRGHPAPTQALATLQQAASQASHGAWVDKNLKSRIALKLGQTLASLGRMNEARKAIEPAFRAAPGYPDLAYTYAKILLDLGDYQAAIPALAAALPSMPEALPPRLDYARALLVTGQEPAEAVAVLKTVLSMSPQHPEAQALFAEALAANGELEAALTTYQSAIDTELIRDPVWSSRLGLGLGKTALALNKVDIAVAALEEASHTDPENPHVYQALTEAFEAAGLEENALGYARTALRLAHEDPETLAWFAEQALRWAAEGAMPKNSESSSPGKTKPLMAQLGIEAVNALSQASHLAPERTILRLQLGKAQMKTGDRRGALETLCGLAEAEAAKPIELRSAAEMLLELRDPATAVNCLERALNLSQGTSDTNVDPESLASHKDLLFLLAAAYQQSGNPQAALAALNQAIELDPSSATVISQKATLLLGFGRYPEALECIQAALGMGLPDDQAVILHLHAALIYRTQGDLTAALSHANQVLAAASNPSQADHLAAQILIAEMHQGLLQPETALATLGATPACEENQPGMRAPFDPASYYCLRAELALEMGDGAGALDSLSSARGTAQNLEQDPLLLARIQAVQARLWRQAEETGAAEGAFQEALSAVHTWNRKRERTILPGINPGWKASAAYITVAETALEMERWDEGYALLQQAAEENPLEARSHLAAARCLVLRGEGQRLCEELDVKNHAPGAEATSTEARLAFERFIDMAATVHPDGYHAPAISRWHSRGAALFSPNPESAQSLVLLAKEVLKPEDVAAQIGALRSLIHSNGHEKQSSEAGPLSLPKAIFMAVQAARVYPQNPLILTQLALLLAHDTTHLPEALNAARQMARQPAEKGRNALNHALLAKLAFHSGDFSSAEQAIQTALRVWPEEPRWQALAGEIAVEAGDLPAAIEHYEQSVRLESHHVPHYLALAQAYLAQMVVDRSLCQRAIDVLDQACRVAPEQPEPWLALAKVYIESDDEGRMAKAARCAERAITLAPDQPAPLMLRAEIALRAGSYQEAYDRAVAAASLAGGETEANPNETATLLLARALDGLGRAPEALAVVEKALPVARDPLPLLLQRAHLLHKQFGPEKAFASLQELANEFPHEPRPLAELARVLAELGRDDGAVHCAQRALLEARSPAARPDLTLDLAGQAQMHYLIGRLQHRSGQLDQAIHHLNEALRTEPQLLEAYLTLGKVYQERRQHVQALSTYKQAQNVAPRDYRSYFQAGLALKESKDYQSAEEMLRLAAEFAPQDLTIHRQLGAVVALNLVHNPRRKGIGL